MAVIRQKLQETSPIICEVRRAVSGNRRTATLHKPFRLNFRTSRARSSRARRSARRASTLFPRPGARPADAEHDREERGRRRDVRLLPVEQAHRPDPRHVRGGPVHRGHPEPAARAGRRVVLRAVGPPLLRQGRVADLLRAPEARPGPAAASSSFSRGASGRLGTASPVLPRSFPRSPPTSPRRQVYEETLCGYQDATETVINPRDKNAKQTWHGRDLVVLAGRTTTQPKRFEGRSTLNKSGAGKRRSTNKGRRSLISGRPSRVATVYATAGPLAAPTKTLPE